MIRLGPFDLEEPVGKGGMGEIWAAVHRDQRVPAAVKVLTMSRAQDFGFRSAFRKEVRAVAGLDHPNVVVVFDHGEVTDEASADSDGRLVARSPFLAMEFVPGGSLADKRGTMPWVDLRETLLQLLGALAHAHSRGVIHRDIKPGNVLVRRDGTVKLSDFGLAHAMARRDDDGTDPGRRGGTPAYMAPEQLQGAWRDFGPWTDLYALGCLAWAMATGRAPFSGNNWVEVMHAHLAEDPPPLRASIPVPDELEGWLRKLLAKHPAHRFRRAADAAWALLQIPVEVQEPHNATPDPAPAGPEGTSGARMHRTTLFWSDREVPGSDVELREGVARSPELERRTFARPPIPNDWRRLELGRTRLLRGAGLGLYGLRSIALVGRDAERDTLWSLLREVEGESRARVAWIHGPVGCGKTALARWLSERAHEVGAAQVLLAIHNAVPGPATGLPRMMANALGTVGMASEAVAERIQDLLTVDGVDDEYEWRALTDVVAPGRSGRHTVKLASPRERHLLLTRWLAQRTAERPILMLLDDVQWGADAVGLVQHVMAHAPELPILFLLTSRDEGQGGAVLSKLRKLVATEGGTDLALDRLEPVHASALVRDLLGLRGELADQVEKRAAGNPLFAVQLVGDWVRRGLLVDGDRGFSLVSGAKIHLPDDLHQVWSEALQPVLERSPAGARVTLELAAALGQRQDEGEWRALCREASAPEPRTVIDLCVEAGLSRTTEAGWEFVHAMLRESLERTAREKGRWQRHNLHCARMLADLYPERPDEIAGRIGRHLLVAGRATKALDLLLRGVSVHADRSEYREALELLDRRDRALEDLGATSDDPRRIQGWLRRARVYMQQGRPHLAEAWAERAERATRKRDEELHALALARLADVFHHRGQVEAAERRYLAALATFLERKDWESVGDCRLGLGQLADRRGRYDRARELLGEARAAFAAVNAPLKLARCIDGLAKAHRKMGKLDQARALADEALARYEGLGSASGVATALRRLAVLDLITGDHPRARERLRRALGLYERIGDPLGQSYCFNALAESSRFTGDLEHAEVGYRRALEIGEAIGTGDRLIPMLNLALVVLRQRRFSEARSLLEETAEKLEEDGRRALLGGTHIGLMACAAAAGDLSAFELHFHLARKIDGETGMIDPDAAWPAEMAGGLLAERGELDWARACFEVALSHWKALGRIDDIARVREQLHGTHDT